MLNQILVKLNMSCPLTDFMIHMDKFLEHWWSSLGLHRLTLIVSLLVIEPIIIRILYN
jgi:hypothetical protein